MLVYPEEIFKEISKRSGLPIEHVRVIFIDFFHQLKINLQNPDDNFLRGIRIEKCCKFTVNPKRVSKTYLNALKKGTDTKSFLEAESYHLKLKKYGIYTKRQEELIEERKRLILQESGDIGSNTDEV